MAYTPPPPNVSREFYPARRRNRHDFFKSCPRGRAGGGLRAAPACAALQNAFRSKSENPKDFPARAEYRNPRLETAPPRAGRRGNFGVKYAALTPPPHTFERRQKEFFREDGSPYFVTRGHKPRGSPPRAAAGRPSTFALSQPRDKLLLSHRD